MGTAIYRLDIAAGALIFARPEHTVAIILTAVGLGLLVCVSEVDLQALIELHQQLVARGDGLFKIEILTAGQVRIISSVRHANRAAGLWKRHAGILKQQRIIDETWIVKIARSGPERDVILEDRDIDDAIRLIAELAAMALGEEPAVHFAFENVCVGAVGDVADSAGERTQAVKGALWPEQRFYPRNIK